MGRGTSSLAVAAATAAVLLGPAAAVAAKGNVKFGGDTEQARKAKLVADEQGRVIRGSWTILTDCDGQYEDFRVQIQVRSPLDRSTQDGFRDRGSTSDSDGTVSARYKHEVEGVRKGRREIRGEISAEVVFRRNGRKYVTCVADDLEYAVQELRAS